MSKIVLVDIDAVCLDWQQSFDLFMASRGHYPQKTNSYSIASIYNISNELALQLGQEFNQSDHLQSLLPIHGAQCGIRDICDLGFSIIAVTSVGDTEKVKQNRIKNLEGVFGKNTFKEVICLPYGGDKFETLMQWKDSKIPFIEDKWENARDGYDLGLKPILLDYPYNQYYFRDKYATIARFKTWNEITKFIKKL